MYAEDASITKLAVVQPGKSLVREGRPKEGESHGKSHCQRGSRKAQHGSRLSEIHDDQGDTSDRACGYQEDQEYLLHIQGSPGELYQITERSKAWLRKCISLTGEDQQRYT